MKQRKKYKKQRRKKEKKNIHIFFLFLCFAGFLLCILVLHHYKHFAVKGRKITPFLTTSGTSLLLHDQAYSFAGFNMYQIASLPGHNVGCGGYVSNIDAFFSTLRAGSMIRMWAWQGSMAINPTTKQLDWAGIDRVLTAAQKYKQKVIISLGTQSGECDDGQWKDSTWYQGGYKNVTNPAGLTPLSYWDYVQRVVSRYKNSQVIGMWELINEPETSDCAGYTGVDCYGHQTCFDHTKAAVILRQFFDTVGGKVKAIDPNHLIESGLIGTGQCGSDNDNYAYVHQSPFLDVASYHDYNEDDKPMPGDQWNGLLVRLSQMKTIGKPLIIGEVGMLAEQAGIACITVDQREVKMKTKMDTMFANGIAGFLPWNRSPNGDVTCNYDIGNDDPLVNLIKTYQLP